MFDPAQLTLGQVSSVLRDFTVVGVLLTVAWKSRGVYEKARGFFERLTNHMDSTEKDMQTLLGSMDVLVSNHLTHIERDLKIMARRQVRAIEALEANAAPDHDPDIEA